MSLSEKIFKLTELYRKPNLSVFPKKEKLIKRGYLSWEQKDKVINIDNIKQAIKELNNKINHMYIKDGTIQEIERIIIEIFGEELTK